MFFLQLLVYYISTLFSIHFLYKYDNVIIFQLQNYDLFETVHRQELLFSVSCIERGFGPQSGQIKDYEIGFLQFLL
jgi:hypothetical protein